MAPVSIVIFIVLNKRIEIDFIEKAFTIIGKPNSNMQS